ncbi:LysR family transcriptional regulator [Paenibacillus wulumuqiensis]|uniref:LysR family transcriptional regulator n=1 Tax=Paenibacillus wulumuqiensis TaxID=1567107 RepID=UPI000619BAB5|nr:LysR family transcriptional regulator [Paenibacillus wulumuqiensis]
MTINLNQLDIFIHVAETMNITESARQLFISQPAVSKGIRKLEESLGIKLFIRDKHQGLLLTAAGEEMLLLARQMKKLEQQMQQLACEENQLLRGKVRIGSFPAATTNLLPEVIRLFRSRYPQIMIELKEGTSQQIREWLEQRVVEIGILSSPFDHLDTHVLIHDRMVAIIPDDHPLIHQESIALEQYDGELIFCTGGHEAALLSALQHNQMTMRESLTVQSVETLVHMTGQYLGIGIVSRFSLSSVRHSLTVKEIQPPVVRDIGIAALSWNDMTPAARQFAELIREMYCPNSP